ncbi:MAG: metal ABC transporter permease, partial [Bacteroidetes bacterium]
LDTWSLGGIGLGPRTIWILGGLLIVMASLIYFAYKPLTLTSFDPLYAASSGISVAFWHYVLMSMVSLATVLSFESVGAILVIAFLVGPAATARLLTQSLPRMLGLAVLFGILASVGGYFLAVWIDGSIAGAMAAVIGIEFVLALAALHLLRKRSPEVFAQTEA